MLYYQLPLLINRNLRILYFISTRVILEAVLFIALILIIPIVAGLFIPKNLKEINTENNISPFFRKEKAQIGAHRAGAGIAPENTPMAFDICLKNENFKVQELEFDIHITKDGKLIVHHDHTLDRTTDAVEMFGRNQVKPSELTYDEIRKLNPAEDFVSDTGEMPFKGLRGNNIPNGLYIPLLEEIIDKIETEGKYLYSIDIKDSGDLGKKAADNLIRLINEKGIADRVMIATFNSDITKYLSKNHPSVQRSVGLLEGIIFYLCYALNLKLKPEEIGFKAVQLPANQYKIIRPGTERFVRYCHKYGIAVQYWTIDDLEEIKRLNNIGADCIITNVPDKMYNLLYK